MAILHSVFFYFANNDDKTEIEAQRSAILNELSTIPVVKWVKAGAPYGVVRDVVDNEYAMSLHLEVASKEDLDTYQVHPTHLEFGKRFKANWAKVRVFDTEI